MIARYYGECHNSDSGFEKIVVVLVAQELFSDTKKSEGSFWAHVS